MSILIFSILMGCFAPFPVGQEKSFSDNPDHDYDKDFMTEAEGDCNDLDPNIQNGPWYYDGDGDGFGDPDNPTSDCNNREGYVTDNTDCNDNDIGIFPGNARNEEADACVQDLDGDGYGSMLPTVPAGFGRDCNDENPLVYPGKNEESGDLCVLDEDEDGFGDINAFPPYDVGTDCDDSDNNVHPDEQEVCDLVDNDCNGEVDDYYGSNAPRWYLDSDGDGFGDINYMLHQCADENGDGPEPYVSNFDDCDDGHADSHPYVEGMSGGVEVCDEEERDENCNGVANEPSASDALTWYQDADGDGYGNLLISQTNCEQPSGFVLDNTDCDDSSITANPGQTEVCDEEDNDCNSLVDEVTAIDLVTYYIDIDADGFGNPTESIVVCPMYQPSNYVIDNTDCDDGDPNQNPSAQEDCNGEDDNCDGTVDEGSGSSAPSNTPMWYFDADGDGFGDPSESLLQCIEPVGYVLNDTDCDDSNLNIHPDADELCTLTVDENCDGDMTYGVHPSLLPSWYPDSDGDGYGNPNFIIQICQQPQNYVDNPDDCNDTDEWVHPEDDFLHLDGTGQFIEHQELCNGKVDLCENDLLGDLTPLDNELDSDGDGYVECTLDVDPLLWEDTSVVILGGEDCDDARDYRYPLAPERCNGIYDDCNFEVTVGGFPPDEVDDDGDCFVECSGFDASQWEGGAHTCSYRDINSAMVTETIVIGGDDCNDDAMYTYVGAAPQTNPSVCLTDLDGDGVSDRSWDLCPQQMTFADARYHLQGTVSGAALNATTGGDFTGDGINDILYDGYGRGSSNRVYLLDVTQFTETTPILDQSTWNYKENPTTFESGRFGFIADIDGDGLSEFGIGSDVWGSDDPGRIVVYLSTTYTQHLNTATTHNHDISFTGPELYDYLQNFSSAGDIDLDGRGDLLIHYPSAQYNFTTVGTVHLFLGSTLLSLTGTDINPVNSDYTFFGFSSGSTINLDGDNLPDFILYDRDGLCSRCGEMYIYFGTTVMSGPTVFTRSEADRVIQGNQYRHYLALSAVADIDGDGLGDMLLKESIDAMGYHLLLGTTILDATSTMGVADADITFVGGDIVGTKFSRSVGDIDADGLDDIILGWAGTFNGVYHSNYASLFLGSTLVELLTDAEVDTGNVSEDPIEVAVQDADFIFSDVTSAANMGDIDQDGLGEFMLKNSTFSYAANSGGVNAIFSACEN